MMQCRVIVALILVQVCDGGYGRNVMKKAINVQAVPVLLYCFALLVPGLLVGRQSWGVRTSMRRYTACRTDSAASWRITRPLLR
jgi:hypothetical protein